MTIDEYNKKNEDYDVQIIALRNKKIELSKEFINEMTKKYENFIGKKVKISFTGFHSETSVVGYFNGFIMGRFCPIMHVFKVKKDGTKSKQIFNGSELPHYDDNFKIELVDMNVLKEDLDLIAGWLEHIQQLADNKKALNGDIMSEAYTLDEIKALSTRSANFIKKRYLSEKIK